MMEWPEDFEWGEPLRLHRNPWALHGGLYMEFQAGQFSGKHRSPKAVFIREEFWGDLEWILVANFDGWGMWSHYGITVIPAKHWQSILDAFSSLSLQLQKSESSNQVCELVPCLTSSYPPVSGRNWRLHALQFAMLIRDFVRWVNCQLAYHGCISIIGI